MNSVPKRTPNNSSAAHVFTVLRFVAESEEPLGVTEISRRLGLPASTVFRALLTLEETDYIQRYQNRPRLEIGTMPHLLARALYNRFPLRRACSVPLRRLAEETGETVSISARLGWYALRIAGAFGSHDTYHFSHLGETVLLHDSAEGRIILASLDATARAAYTRFVEQHHAGHVPSDGWQELNADLALDASRGYAVQGLPAAPGFHAVALPVRDAAGTVVSAILVEGPVLQDGEVRLPPAIPEARDRLEILLGSAPEAFISPFNHIPADDIRLRIA